MARSARLSEWMPAVTRGILVTLVLSGQTAAQPAPPCRPGDSLLSLGKAAFFRSVERGAFAIGERTLDDLTDGLGANTAAGPARGPKRKGATPPARVRAATFAPASDATLAGALKAYVDSPSSDAADLAFEAFLEAATKILFETLPAPGEASHVGLVLEGGQFFNRTSTFPVRDMTNEGKRQSLEFSAFGDGPDLEMGKVNPMLSQAPFFKAPVIADGHNLDRNNLGIEVNTEQDLRARWFDDYRAYLATEDPGRSPAQITEALNAGWPILQKFWALKRTGIFIDRALMTFGTEMRQIYRRATEENLPTGVCDPKRPAQTD